MRVCWAFHDGFRVLTALCIAGFGFLSRVPRVNPRGMMYVNWALPLNFHLGQHHRLARFSEISGCRNSVLSGHCRIDAFPRHPVHAFLVTATVDAEFSRWWL